MKKQILFLIICLYLISLVGIVSASLDIRVDVKNSFIIGETVKFDYTFISGENEEIVYTPRIKCLGGYETLLSDIKLSLTKDIPFTDSYEGFEVTDDTISQQCLAIIKVKEPFIQVKEEEFEVISLLSFNLDLRTCKDKECGEESKIFLKNQDIYLDYISDIGLVNIIATLKYPDGKTENINLPWEIKANQIGTYELDIEASKQGYRTIAKKGQFAVIEKEADISDISVCNVDGQCLGEENSQNCPQDCRIFKDEIRRNKFLFISMILVGIILLIILIIYFIKRE